MLFLYLAGGLFLFELVFLLWCVAWERPFSGMLSAFAVLLAASWLLGWNLWEVVSTNPIWLVAGSVSYLVAGVAWSFPKWWFFVRGIRDSYLESKERYLSHTPNPTDRELRDFISLNKSDWDNQSIPPHASKNKNRIFTWVVYWPFSFVWTMLDEPLNKFFNLFWDYFSGVYQGISESVFSDVS